MSLNNIQLPPYLIQELYRDSLIAPEKEAVNQEPIKKDVINFLGRNEKHLLVVVNEPGVVFISDEHLKFLTDILGACKLSLSDIALVNCSNSSGINYQSLLGSFSPNIILFFGTEPAKLDFPLQFPFYQLQAYNNQTYLSAPGLSVLLKDVTEKKQLWGCLKKLFSI